MAYGLKYQSTFYNYFKRPVIVQLYKNNYVGSVISIRVASLTIATNYQDNKTPVIGTGAKVKIINSTDNFTYFDDLLISKEKEFKCVITVNGEIVYTGFSLCDLNEQQFLPKSVITIQFTDYLRRLSDKYLEDLPSALGYASSLFTLVSQSLNLINIGHTNLLVNSSIFETRMTQTALYSFLEQAYIENELFLDKDNKQDDVYTILNKILLSFNCHLYSYAQNWIIERTEDIDRTTNWLAIDLSTGTKSAGTNYRTVLNKQAGDFSYTNMSQVLKYYTGIHTLTLNIKDKQKESLVTNNLNEDTILAYTDGLSLKYNTWYIGGDPYSMSSGINLRKISRYFIWATFNTTYTPFAFNVHPESLRYKTRIRNLGLDKTILSFRYKAVAPVFYPVAYETIYLTITVFVRSGPNSGDIIWLDTNSVAAYYHYSQITYRYITTKITVDKSDLTPNVTTFEFIKDIDITNLIAGKLYEDYEFVIYPILNTGNGVTAYFGQSAVGDFQVTIKEASIDNKFDYNISDDYIKQEEIDIALCDVDNDSYVNGMLLPVSLENNEFNRTISWISGNGNTRILQDKFAEEWYRKYSNTNRNILADIVYDGYLKLFTIFTDDNINDASDNNIQFVLTNYTWDVVNGIYTIELEEYPDEDIIIETA